jgi:hypothetical protein
MSRALGGVLADSVNGLGRFAVLEKIKRLMRHLLVWCQRARSSRVNQELNDINQSPRLLLDGQQRLTSLLAVIRGKPVSVRGRQRPIELLFDLEDHRIAEGLLLLV